MKKLLVLIGLFLIILNSFSQVKQFRDTIYHFSFEYPDTWVLTEEKGKDLRARLISDDGMMRLEAYGIFVEAGHIDLELYAAKDTVFFQNLGKSKDTEHEIAVPYIGKYLAYLEEGADEVIEIRKTYHPNKNGEYAISYFAVDEHYAYALIAYSKTDNFDRIELVFESFEKTSTRKIKRENDKSSAHKEKIFLNILTWFLIFLYFSLLMLAGRNFKKWSHRRKALLRFKEKLDKGNKVDRKWKYAYGGASKKLAFSIALFIFLFLAGIFLNSANWYVYVAAPVAFTLGYLGFTLLVDDPS